MRSVSKALADASMLVSSLKLKRDEIISVDVCPRGAICFHLRTEGFMRIFKALRVPGAKVKAHVHEQSIHARFVHYGAEWFSIFRMGQSQWDALIGNTPPRIASQPRISANSIRINDKSELLCLPSPRRE